MAEGSAAVKFRVAGNQGVQRLRIGLHHVPHIGFSLEPSFNLEGAHARLRQVFQAVQEVIVFQGEKGFVAHQNLAGSVLQVVEIAAGLGAGAAVGASAGEVFG